MRCVATDGRLYEHHRNARLQTRRICTILGRGDGLHWEGLEARKLETEENFPNLAQKKKMLMIQISQKNLSFFFKIVTWKFIYNIYFELKCYTRVVLQTTN